MRPPFLLCAALVAAAGCGGESQPPFGDLHPVTGTVTQGGQPVGGGSVRFVPDRPAPEFVYTADVGPDGRFTLQTVRTTDRGGERKPGAPAGSYTVTFTPAAQDQSAVAPQPYEWRQPVAVEAKANDLKLDVPRPRKK